MILRSRMPTKWQGRSGQTSKTDSLRRRRRAGSRKTARTSSAAAPRGTRLASRPVAVPGSARLPAAGRRRHRARRLGDRGQGRLAGGCDRHRADRRRSTRFSAIVQEAKAENAVAALARMTAVTSAVVRDGQAAARAQRRAGAWRRARARRGRRRRRGCAPGAGRVAARAGGLADRRERGRAQGRRDAARSRRRSATGSNMVFKGTAVAQGTGRAVVTATGMDTEMGAIAEMLEATAEEPTPLQKEVGAHRAHARASRSSSSPSWWWRPSC